MNDVIQTINLRKYYGKIKAVDGISLKVKQGEIYGFLGLNGAGKTTTMRLLLGLIRPTSGECYLNGIRVTPGNTALWSHVGYLVEVPYAYPELTVFENLEICRRLRLIRSQEPVHYIIEKLKLKPYINRKARDLSLGNAQRLGLAKALISKPSILLLDEPSNGLDPEGIVEIRELLINLARSEGVTIFVSSHILGEISKLATRIGIIHEGKMIEETTLEQLDRDRKRSLIVETPENQSAFELLIGKGFSVERKADGILEITDSEAIKYPETIARLMVENNLPLRVLQYNEEDLETHFLKKIHPSPQWP